MRKLTDSWTLFPFYCLLITGSSLLILVWILSSPSEPANSIAFGLSLPRLIFACGFLVITIAAAALAIKAFNNPIWAENKLEQWFGGGRYSRLTAWFAGIGLGLGWIGCFLPSYRVGLLGGYWNRIQPVMAFLLIAGIATLLVSAVRRSGFSVRNSLNSGTYRLGLILFLTSLSILTLMLFTKFGVYAREDFWYGAGVPLLASQMIMAVLGGLLFLLISKGRGSKKSDLVIFILLYAVTAVLWAREPLQKSFLFIGPYPPNDVLYPFADAATFDAASQFGLIGQGILIFNTPFFERALYLSFLVYLHSLFGQNYETLMAVQAAIFAVFPALVYWIGRSINMRAVGFSSAIIATLRGVNSIAASNMIDMANPKMMLTDFPTAIGVALLILFACEWLKRPGQRWDYAVWVGGAIGLALMLRTNALVFLVFIPLYALLKFVPQWKNWLIASILIWFAVMAVTLPWEIRNLSRGGMMYSSIAAKIQNVIRTRYTPPADTEGYIPQEKILSLVIFQQTNHLLSLTSTTNVAQEQSCQTITCFAPQHFLHNVITSILILPTSPIMDDIRHTVKGDLPFWRPDWEGNFTPIQLLFLAINISIIVLGISITWKQQQLAGLVLLAVFMFYILSNSLARTSGGRYIVPVDWILSFYFVVGILFLIKEIADVTNIKLGALFDLETQNHDTPTLRSPWVMITINLLLLFGAGTLVPLAEMLHSPRYSGFDFAEVLQEQETQIVDAGLTMEQINAFLQNPGADMLVGRTLYPRSYRIGQGEIAFNPYTVMEFPRTGFVLIGPKGEQPVLLPGDVPKHLPHASDVLVIGCREQNYIDALVVILLDGTGIVHIRSPRSGLTCPMKQPVCDDNRVCE